MRRNKVAKATHLESHLSSMTVHVCSICPGPVPLAQRSAVLDCVLECRQNRVEVEQRRRLARLRKA